MTHDEAVKVLKELRERLSWTHADKALDYAIAVMEKGTQYVQNTNTIEPIATQFDERLSAVNRLYSDNHQNEVNDFLLTLANEMQIHIRKLEANPKWNREV